MALDSAGNIYLCGPSQNTNGGTGYAVVKYAANGTQLWAARFDSNAAAFSPSSFTLDASNNAIVTGNGGTVKYDTSGNLAWSNFYAGLSTAVDLSNNIVVTGFGTLFNTVKLNPAGSNVWLAVYQSNGPAISQAVAIDGQGAVYVCGSDVWYCPSSYCYCELTIIKYAPNGTRLWISHQFCCGNVLSFTVRGMTLATDGYLYTLLDYDEGAQIPYNTLKLTADGVPVWDEGDRSRNDSSVSHALAVGRHSNLVVTGKNGHYYPNSSYGTYGLNGDGTYTWTNTYPQIPTSANEATAVALDKAENAYVTGYFAGSNTNYDIVTIAYDTSGKQLWLQRYDGAAHLDDVGNAIAVDGNGNVYVAGYETVAGGGTEMVLIKYAPVTVQKQSSGILLQAQGSPNEPFDIRATTNLETWPHLATTNADANGLLQYLDTNAQLYPWRFYLAIPQ